MVRAGLLMLSLLAFTGSARAETLFDHPADAASMRRLLGAAIAELQTAQTLRGDYTQRKQLPELPRPLLAQGDFLFVRDHGIRWRTLTPFASELIITPDRLVQRDAGSEVRVGAEQQPAIRMVGRIFLAVFSLDFDALGELFTLYADAPVNGAWRIGLAPRQSAGSLKTIEVSGRQRVEHVVLHEGAGDVTELELHDTVASPSAPSAQDLAPFAP